MRGYQKIPKPQNTDKRHPRQCKMSLNIIYTNPGTKRIHGFLGKHFSENILLEVLHPKYQPFFLGFSSLLDEILAWNTYVHIK